MAINWSKKNSVTLKWAGVGPGFLLYQIFVEDKKLFNNGMLEGVLLSAFCLLLPGVAALAVYWPTTDSAKQPSEGEPND